MGNLPAEQRIHGAKFGLEGGKFGFELGFGRHKAVIALIYGALLVIDFDLSRFEFSAPVGGKFDGFLDRH